MFRWGKTETPAGYIGRTYREGVRRVQTRLWDQTRAQFTPENMEKKENLARLVTQCKTTKEELARVFERYADHELQRDKALKQAFRRLQERLLTLLDEKQRIVDAFPEDETEELEMKKIRNNSTRVAMKHRTEVRKQGARHSNAMARNKHAQEMLQNALQNDTAQKDAELERSVAKRRNLQESRVLDNFRDKLRREDGRQGNQNSHDLKALARISRDEEAEQQRVSKILLKDRIDGKVQQEMMKKTGKSPSVKRKEKEAKKRILHPTLVKESAATIIQRKIRQIQRDKAKAQVAKNATGEQEAVPEAAPDADNMRGAEAVGNVITPPADEAKAPQQTKAHEVKDATGEQKAAKRILRPPITQESVASTMVKKFRQRKIDMADAVFVQRQKIELSKRAKDATDKQEAAKATRDKHSRELDEHQKQMEKEGWNTAATKRDMEHKAEEERGRDRAQQEDDSLTKAVAARAEGIHKQVGVLKRGVAMPRLLIPHQTQSGNKAELVQQDSARKTGQKESNEARGGISPQQTPSMANRGMEKTPRREVTQYKKAKTMEKSRVGLEKANLKKSAKKEAGRKERAKIEADRKTEKRQEAAATKLQKFTRRIQARKTTNKVDTRREQVAEAIPPSPPKVAEFRSVANEEDDRRSVNSEILKPYTSQEAQSAAQGKVRGEVAAAITLQKLARATNLRTNVNSKIDTRRAAISRSPPKPLPPIKNPIKDRTADLEKMRQHLNDITADEDPPQEAAAASIAVPKNTTTKDSILSTLLGGLTEGTGKPKKETQRQTPQATQLSNRKSGEQQATEQAKPTKKAAAKEAKEAKEAKKTELTSRTKPATTPHAPEKAGMIGRVVGMLSPRSKEGSQSEAKPAKKTELTSRTKAATTPPTPEKAGILGRMGMGSILSPRSKEGSQSEAKQAEKIELTSRTKAATTPRAGFFGTLTGAVSKIVSPRGATPVSGQPQTFSNTRNKDGSQSARDVTPVSGQPTSMSNVRREVWAKDNPTITPAVTPRPLSQADNSPDSPAEHSQIIDESNPRKRGKGDGESVEPQKPREGTWA
jgi:hypothetical protein